MSTEALSKLLNHAGFEHHGFAALTRPFSLEIYESWLSRGLHGEMDYLARHLPQKAEPQKLMSRAQSAIVVTLDYVPHPAPIEAWPLKGGVKVAAYARGFDYHYVLKAKLKALITQLEIEYPGEEFRCFTDSAPVLERDLAARAGLGWIGKNTCLLSRTEGSLFLIAEIYTTLQLPVAGLNEKDFCGSCTRCLDACPTGALTKARELDARKCISYLTIESREVPPLELRPYMQDWFFGCDICQTVCPWNEKVYTRKTLSALNVDDREALVEDLRFLLTTSHRGLERAFHGTPLARAGGWGLKRNAIVVAANKLVREVRPLIEALVDDAKLGELASWALICLEIPSE